MNMLFLDSLTFFLSFDHQVLRLFHLPNLSSMSSVLDLLNLKPLDMKV